MIGISVGDLLKVLDQIPIWKAVSQLPKRIAALEARVEALETKLAGQVSQPATGVACPVCDARMRVLKEVDDPLFGFAGVKERTLICDQCGTQTTRQVDPGK